MKKFFYIIPALTISMATVLVSCGDKEEPPAPTSALNGGGIQPLDGGGGLEPLEPLDGGEVDAGGADEFAPDDNFEGDGEPPPDGAADAGAPDGAADAGAPDGAADAGAADAGAADAGAADAGAADAGAADAGAADAGAADAGAADAGAADAGAADAGAADAGAADGAADGAAPTPAPTDSAAATPTPDPSASASPTASPTPTPTPTPTPVPTPTPTPTPNYGNGSLGAIATNSIIEPSGIDIKNGVIYSTHFADEFFSNKRIVKGFNSSGTQVLNDITVFSTTTGTTPLLTGVAVDGSTIWSALKTHDDNVNLYKHDSTGTQLGSFDAGQGLTGVQLTDIAIDVNTDILYLADPVHSTVIKFDESDSQNSTLYFTGQGNPVNAAGLHVDPAGNVWIANTTDGKVYKYNSAGSLQLSFDGKGINNQGTIFSGIGDVAVDPRNGDIYVLGFLNDNISQVFRFKDDGAYVHSFGGGEMSAPDKIGGITIGTDGTIFVVDQGIKGIVKFAAGQNP